MKEDAAPVLFSQKPAFIKRIFQQQFVSANGNSGSSDSRALWSPVEYHRWITVKFGKDTFPRR